MEFETSLLRLLESVQRGELEPQAAAQRMKTLPFEDVGFARLDHHRAVRTGFPEVVFCPGKTPDQVAQAVARLADTAGVALATRASLEQADAVLSLIQDAAFHETARAITVDRRPPRPPLAGLIILTAGTSDAPVAEEAAVTATLMGCPPQRIYDAGVAGLHRLLDRLPTLQTARAIVAVAGMEGAMPGVVTGLVSAPVIAVPTSVGYGAHLNGLAPLLTMLNGCAPGMAVVNIDNGFAAGYMAALITRSSVGLPEPTAVSHNGAA